MHAGVRIADLIKMVLLPVCLFCGAHAHGQANPLANAFAHNDYKHKHPLYDALENGYRNIEVDIYKRRGNLVVAHFPPHLFQRKRSLESLYLKPLFEEIACDSLQENSNHQHQILLMIDIKSKANRTYRKLAPLLEQYKSILTSCENGEFTNRPLTIVLSGHKPYKLIRQNKRRYAFIDEDLRNVNTDTAFSNIYPIMASCKYGNLLKWKGEGNIPIVDKSRLCYYTRMAHAFGKKVRLWASPENKVVWKELLDCGVDLICTDKLIALKNFLSVATPASVNVENLK